MTFDEWWDEQVKATGFSDPWEDTYAASKDAWKAAQDATRSQVLRYQEIIDKCREKIDTLEGHLYDMSERQGE